MSYILSFKAGKCTTGNSASKSVLRCLCDYAEDDGKKCNPSIDTIALETECNRKTIFKALAHLSANSWILIQRGHDKRKNIYVLNIKKINHAYEQYKKLKELIKNEIDEQENQFFEEEFSEDACSEISPKNGIVPNSVSIPNMEPSPSLKRNRVRPKNGTLLSHNSVITQSSSTNSTSDEKSEVPEEENFELTSDEKTESKPQDPVAKVANRCPIKKFIDIYHETLPMGTPVRTWKSAKRIKIMKARWKELVEDEKCESEEAALSILRDFFINAIASSNFLTGKIPPRNPNDAPFQISLEWILNEGNWDRIVDGYYVNRKKNTPPNNSYPPRGY